MHQCMTSRARGVRRFIFLCCDTWRQTTRYSCSAHPRHTKSIADKLKSWQKKATSTANVHLIQTVPFLFFAMAADMGGNVFDWLKCHGPTPITWRVFNCPCNKAPHIFCLQHAACFSLQVQLLARVLPLYLRVCFQKANTHVPLGELPPEQATNRQNKLRKPQNKLKKMHTIEHDARHKKKRACWGP